MYFRKSNRHRSCWKRTWRDRGAGWPWRPPEHRNKQSAYAQCPDQGGQQKEVGELVCPRARLPPVAGHYCRLFHGASPRRAVIPWQKVVGRRWWLGSCHWLRRQLEERIGSRPFEKVVKQMITQIRELVALTMQISMGDGASLSTDGTKL